MAQDCQSSGMEAESDGLATLRELSSEVARQKPDLGVCLSEPCSSLDEPCAMKNEVQDASKNMSLSAAAPSVQKNVQFVLVGGQKYPVTQNEPRSVIQSTNFTNTVSTLPKVQPAATMLQNSGAGPGCAIQSPMVEQDVSVSRAEEAQTAFSQQQQQQQELVKPQQQQQQQQQPNQQANAPVVLKVPANKLALKGQIVRTADQKLMLVTEVGGKKVGYLIRQQNLQVGQPGPLSIGNSMDNRGLNVSLASAISGNGGQKPGSSAMSNVTTLVSPQTSIAESPSAIAKSPSPTSQTTAVGNMIETTRGNTCSIPERIELSDGTRTTVKSESVLCNSLPSSNRGETVPPVDNSVTDQNVLADSMIIENTEGITSDVGSKDNLTSDQGSANIPPTTSAEETIPLSAQDRGTEQAQKRNESSDDDSTPLAAVAASLKAEQKDLSHSVRNKGTPKKEKGKKRGRPKKKKDQIPKPVPPYQMFFKDIQANIRAENPTATFGEVSKIVSQTWEGLDAEKKQVYHDNYEIAREEHAKKVADMRRLEEQEESTPLASLIGRELPSRSPEPTLSERLMDVDMKNAGEERNEETALSSVSAADYTVEVNMREVEPRADQSTDSIEEEGSEMEVDKSVENDDELNENTAPLVNNEITTLTDSSESKAKENLSKRQKKGSKIREPKEPKKRRKKKIREPVVIEEIERVDQDPDTAENSLQGPVKITVKISDEGKVVKLDQTITSANESIQSTMAAAPKFRIPIRGQKTDVIPAEGKQETGDVMDVDEAKPRSAPNVRLCVREDCSNPVKPSRERGTQYCSNDCLVLHCRNVFNLWVEERKSDTTES